MEIKVLEKSKTKMLLEIGGEDHTLCNAIKEELNNDKKVKVASYKIEHPLTAKPVMLIEADDTKVALEGAVKRLIANNKEFAKVFAKI